MIDCERITSELLFKFSASYYVATESQRQRLLKEAAAWLANQIGEGRLSKIEERLWKLESEMEEIYPTIT